jgi:FlaA1/EpsC-like NDP-sugar epimerase
MGEQVRIVDLAESMVRFRGLRVGKDIEFVYTGLRPGEKLTEELVAGMENMQPTDHPKVLRLNGNGSTIEVQQVVARLQSLVIGGEVEAACATLWEAVHEDAKAHAAVVMPQAVPCPMPEPFHISTDGVVR